MQVSWGNCSNFFLPWSMTLKSSSAVMILDLQDLISFTNQYSSLGILANSKPFQFYSPKHFTYSLCASKFSTIGALFQICTYSSCGFSFSVYIVVSATMLAAVLSSLTLRTTPFALTLNADGNLVKKLSHYAYDCRTKWTNIQVHVRA